MRCGRPENFGHHVITVHFEVYSAGEILGGPQPHVDGVACLVGDDDDDQDAGAGA